MIPCTEFIPAYSELFTWLEEQKGPEEVDRYWKWLFDPAKNTVALDGYLEREGLKGFYSCYEVTLSEEAADFTNFYSEKGGWYKGVMHYCPSKGRLLELQKRNPAFVPYHNYCLHCDNYRLSAEKAGFGYIFDFEGTDEARCVEFAYDPKVFNGKVIVDEDTLILDRRASDNEYFHQNFHAGMSNSIEYLGTFYGKDAVGDYTEKYMHHVYPEEMKKCREEKLKAVEAFLRFLFEREKAGDALSTGLSADGKKLSVRVEPCPQITYLRKSGLSVSEYLEVLTKAQLAVLAREAGAQVAYGTFDAETGSREYEFSI